MDRRRYVPSTEGLEGRALLASGLFGGTLPNSDPTATVPMTFILKEHRIERLPHFLEQIKPGRSLPINTVMQLQTDLLSIATELHAPGSNFLDGFNSELRKVSPRSSLSTVDAAALNRSFAVVVKATGATPDAVSRLRNDMNALTRFDSTSSQPVFLATNDYTLVLQTILGVGRPIRRPTVAELAANNGTRVGLRFGVTPKSQPTLVGTYDAFATVQVVNANGDVFGTTTVKKQGATQSNGVALDNGKYAVTLDTPLADGVYTFYIRAMDNYGHVSHYSPPFKLKINTHLVHHTATSTIPGGPLAVQ